MSALEKYLNEHFAGSGAALQLLLVLARKNPADHAVYEELYVDILVNRRILERVMVEEGFKRSWSMQLAARATAWLMSWRFNRHGLERGELGLVEALEALQLGIHGQTLLWKSLMQQPHVLECEGVDYEALHKRAELQKARAERLRLDAVQQAFCSTNSRLSI